MGVVAQPNPGVIIPVTGVLMVGLSTARLLAGPGPGIGGAWFAIAVGAVGAGLAVWGFARLRRAQAARPDRSWWGVLRTDLISFGVAAVCLYGWTNLSAEQRDGVVRTIREVFELIHVARGRH